MRGRLYALRAALLFSAILGSSPTHAQSPASPIVSTVADIISFTRWPVQLDSIVLCTVGPVQDAEDFFAAPILIDGTPVRPRRASLASGGLDECNATYAGRMTLPERQQLDRRLAGLSVLTMGEAAPDCTELTMFCLRRDGQVVTFSTNIDMIARGGVRINPRVLQPGRKPAAP